MAFEKCETEIAADRFESTSNGYTIPYCGLIAFRGSYRLIRSITGTVTVLCALQMLPLPGVISGTAVAVRLKEWLKISDWPRRRIFTAKRTRRGLFQDMFARLTEDVDALALCGDLVDYGLPAVAEILLQELSPILEEKYSDLSGIRKLRIRVGQSRSNS
jgi:hypothetical protein